MAILGRKPNYRIKSEHDLESVGKLYHDAKIFPKRIQFKDSIGDYIIPIEHTCSKEILYLNLLLLKFGSCEITASEIRFSGVDSVVMTHQQKEELSFNEQDYDWINTIHYQHHSKSIIIDCIKGLNIRLFVNQLRGEIRGIQKTDKRSYFIYFCGIKFGG